MELPRTAVAVAAPEEVGESPVALAEAAILLRCLLEAGRRSLAAGRAHGGAHAGVAANGTAAIGNPNWGGPTWGGRNWNGGNWNRNWSGRGGRNGHWR